MPATLEPLMSGKRVLITRPRGQGAELARALESLGATVVSMPLIEIGEPADWSPVDRALARLGEIDWLVFTSANGVHALLWRLKAVGLDRRVLARVHLAAIGPGTSAALQQYLLQSDFVPRESRSEELAAGLEERVAGRRVLLARGDRGREILRQELGRVALVEQIVVYTQTEIAEPDARAMDVLRRGEIDFVTVTSSNIARALARHLDRECREHVAAGRTRLVSISSLTSAVLRELDLAPAAEAAKPTMAELVAALAGLNGAR